MGEKKKNESCTAVEARASEKQNFPPCVTHLKTEEYFMVEMPSSGLKVSCVLFLQVDKKLISLHAHYFCNMHWWKGDNNSSLLFICCSFWNLGFHRVLCMSTGAANSPGQALVTEEQLPGMICLFNYLFNHGCSAFVMAIDTVIKA